MELLEAGTFAYDYEQFPKSSARKQRFWEKEEGVMELSESLQGFVNEAEEQREHQTLVASIKTLMQNMQWTVKKAMDALSVPQDKRSIYAGLGTVQK